MDDYCRLQISVSADAFETSEILWNSADEDGEKPWRWHEFSVSLEKYSGRKIQIRFTYGPGKNDSFGTGGYMGDFAIDGLKITGVSTVEQVEAATGEVIAFADMSSGSPTAWQWAFPGGTPSTSTDQNPRVFYTRDGVYDVTLTVSNADGSDTKTRTGFVKVTGSGTARTDITTGYIPVQRNAFADGSSAGGGAVSGQFDQLSYFVGVDFRRCRSRTVCPGDVARRKPYRRI